MNGNRRRFLKACAVTTMVVTMPVARAAGATRAIDVYRDPGCPCCEKWADHLRAHGFVVRTHDAQDTSVYRKRFGVPENIAGCHTAVLGAYVIEGLVPAREIERLLAERPAAAGLAVPSMPPGAPGMESDQRVPYDVLLFARNGRYTVYQHYDA